MPAEMLTIIQPTPTPHVKHRDPMAAVAPWRPRADVPTPADATATLEEQVKSRYWYHTIELPGGIVTEGEFDHRPLVPHYGLPEDLTGKSALDVASFDGFWAFELERRGAQVTSVDVGRISSYDFPYAARRQLETEGLDRPHVPGFDIARRALDSKVQRITSNIYDLNPADHGTYDFVHVADVMLHLESPTRALRAVRSVTGDTAHIVDACRVDFDEGESQAVEYLGGWEVIVWWLPSLSTLAQMVLDAGFRSVRLHAVYVLGRKYGDGGYHRAILVANV